MEFKALSKTIKRFVWLALAIVLQVLLIFLLLPSTRIYASAVGLGLLQAVAAYAILFRLLKKFSLKQAALRYALCASLILLGELTAIVRLAPHSYLFTVSIGALLISLVNPIQLPLTLLLQQSNTNKPSQQEQRQRM
jgi:O-antigen/teichoic acid export membrane protein